MQPIDRFPDGTPIDEWFFDDTVPTLDQLGQPYDITLHGILDDGSVHTEQLQSLIDRVSDTGGGVIVVPPGVYMTGALTWRPGVHLWIEDGGMLRGSDDPADYPPVPTHIEGESCLYFPALINAQGLHGVVFAGHGCIDGNGLRAWRAFWLRRQWNPACTNKDEQRARLLFFDHCDHVTVSGLKLQNAQFWTNHLYQCRHVRYLDCRITSPAAPVKAPSTDAIDIDACTDVVIRRCYMSVNDDAVVLKGGKGPWADTLPENGGNERILVEDCVYGFCHGCLTCGSECIRSRNVLVRRIRVDSGYNLLWLKMRPDTPQHYAYITVEDITGTVTNVINVSPWTQFFDLKGRTDLPVALAEHITLRALQMTCDVCFNIVPRDTQYHLRGFTFSDLAITAADPGLDPAQLQDTAIERVRITP